MTNKKNSLSKSALLAVMGAVGATVGVQAPVQAEDLVVVVKPGDGKPIFSPTVIREINPGESVSIKIEFHPLAVDPAPQLQLKLGDQGPSIVPGDAIAAKIE